MKRMMISVAVLCLGAFPVASEESASDVSELPADFQESSSSARFVNAEGDAIGSATLSAAPNGVLIELSVDGLPAGQWLGVHIHEAGECDPDDGFDSAGSHFNPTDTDHGFLNEAGYHAGDLPNQFVDAEGTMRAQIFNSFVTLGDDGAADVKGRTLIIHESDDSYQSESATGDRIACAVIE